MNEKNVNKSKLDADVQTALYQGLIGLYERLEREHFPRFGHGHSACQAIVAQLSPNVMRDIIDRLPEGTVTDAD